MAIESEGPVSEGSVSLLAIEKSLDNYFFTFKVSVFTGLLVGNQNSRVRIVFSVVRVVLGQHIVQNLYPVLTSKEVGD